MLKTFILPHSLIKNHLSQMFEKLKVLFAIFIDQYETQWQHGQSIWEGQSEMTVNRGQRGCQYLFI